MFQRMINKGKNFIHSFARYSDSIEEARRIYLLIFISLIGVINLIPLGIVALMQKNLILGIADLSVAFILFVNLLHAWGKKRFDFNIYVGISFTAVLYIYLYMTGGVNNSGFVWYFTYPLIATYLTGSRKGGLAATLMLFPVLFHTIFSLPQPFFTRYSADFQLRFILAYVVVFLFSYLFEKTREDTRDKLNKIQDNLEERVKLRTNELSCSNVKLNLEIKERKQIEKKLRKSEKNYRLITESTSDLIAVTTFSQKPVYRYISPSHKTVMGYEPEDLIGKSGFDVIHPNDKKKLLPLLKKYIVAKTKKLLTGKELDSGLTLEYRVKHKSGKWRNLESTVNFIGKQLLFVSRDITERKQTEQEKKELKEKLLHSEKMETLGQLSAGVAHDLNNVLGAIVSYPDLLLMGMPENSVHRKPLLAMKKSGQKAAAIIGDLMALARREVLDKQVVDLNDIVRDYLKSPEFMKLSSFHSGVKVITHLEPLLLSIDGSFIHLTKMLMNMISNAAEAMPSGGTVNIFTFNQTLNFSVKGHEGYISEGEYTVLKISDEGVGIDSKSLKKIFQPFYTKKVMGRSGTGLGMAVVWGTVVDHNGNILVKSAKSKGTTFELYFPVIKGKHPQKMKRVGYRKYQGNGEKILVVDDEADQRDLAFSILTQLGYSVETVSSGEEAIKYMKKKTSDLIILDMIMDHGIDGLDTYKKIKKLKPGIKTIITSGYSETSRVKKALQLGVKQYIKKPFTIEEIGMVIRTELEKK